MQPILLALYPPPEHHHHHQDYDDHDDHNFDDDDDDCQFQLGTDHLDEKEVVSSIFSILTWPMCNEYNIQMILLGIE